MKRVWCWRCKAWVQALDESEYRPIHELWLRNTMSAKVARSNGMTLEDAQSHYAPLIAAHEKLTGERGVSVKEIYNHYLENFGPPCQACCKNLRTPRARQCFECGWDGYAQPAEQ